MERVYVETSVISYLTARPSRDVIVAARCLATQTWWNGHRTGFELYVSQLVVEEARAGDAAAAAERVRLLNDLPHLAVNDAVIELAGSFLRCGSLPQKAATDALHIALAVRHGMDYLLSWNCRHIANARVERAIRELCQDQGLLCPVICTPEELLGDDDVI